MQMPNDSKEWRRQTATVSAGFGVLRWLILVILAISKESSKNYFVIKSNECDPRNSGLVLVLKAPSSGGE